jgi:hypothetical protein
MGILYIEGLSEPNAPARDSNDSRAALTAIHKGFEQAFGDNVSCKEITTDGKDESKRIQHFVMQINIEGLSSERMMEPSTKFQINKLLTRVVNHNQFLTKIDIVDSAPDLDKVFSNKELFSDENLQEANPQSNMKEEFKALRGGSPTNVADGISIVSNSDDEDEEKEESQNLNP